MDEPLPDFEHVPSWIRSGRIISENRRRIEEFNLTELNSSAPNNLNGTPSFRCGSRSHEIYDSSHIAMAERDQAIAKQSDLIQLLEVYKLALDKASSSSNRYPYEFNSDAIAQQFLAYARVELGNNEILK